MGIKLFEQMVEILWEDYKLVHKEIVCNRHHLTSDKIALFGVSLGVILNGSIFSREAFGQRMLGAIGHCDVPHFARSYIFLIFIIFINYIFTIILIYIYVSLLHLFTIPYINSFICFLINSRFARFSLSPLKK